MAGRGGLASADHGACALTCVHCRPVHQWLCAALVFGGAHGRVPPLIQPNADQPVLRGARGRGEWGCRERPFRFVRGDRD
eukprot:scaffold12393_cov105-Isochrysis_galbana.AAC.3